MKKHTITLAMIAAAFLVLTPGSLPAAANKTNMDCSWQNSANYSSGFYRPGGFSMEIGETGALFSDNGYFNRKYEPCWVGGYSSCWFSFETGAGRPYSIVTPQARNFSRGPNELVLEFQAYFTATLVLNFDRAYASMKTGETLNMSLYGNDGDGVFIDNDKFVCVVK